MKFSSQKLLVIAVFVLAGSFGPAFADEVTQWNITASNVVNASGKSAFMQPRMIAMAQLAVHDAINTIDSRYERYALDRELDPGASVGAAVATAARDVLVNQVPAQQAVIDGAYTDALSAVPDGPSKSSGIDIGRAAAAAILAMRTGDGSSTVTPYLPGSGPGVWQPTPPAFAPAAGPGWGTVAPFALKSGSQFRPEDEPPALTSELYTAEFEEVKRVGRATGSERTAEQTEIARFHAEGANFATNGLARILSAQAGLDSWQNARLFALVNMATADGFVSGFDAKYAYNYWRPVTAIRAADSDGNVDTTPDSTWLSLLNTPAHPDYTSTHSVTCGAAAEVMRRFFGTDDLSFTLTSSILPGVTRSFTSLTQWVEEVGDSRVYGGIHFRTACLVGLREGRQVGHFVYTHSLKSTND